MIFKPNTCVYFYKLHGVRQTLFAPKKKDKRYENRKMIKKTYKIISAPKQTVKEQIKSNSRR